MILWKSYFILIHISYSNNEYFFTYYFETDTTNPSSNGCHTHTRVAAPLPLAVLPKMDPMPECEQTERSVQLFVVDIIMDIKNHADL